MMPLMFLNVVLGCDRSACNVIVTHHAKRDLTGIAKSIDPGQSAQADHGRLFSLLADFLYINPFRNDTF